MLPDFHYSARQQPAKPLYRSTYVLPKSLSSMYTCSLDSSDESYHIKALNDYQQSAAECNSDLMHLVTSLQ